MTLFQKSEDGGEVALVGFDFSPGDLEAVTRGGVYQQSLPEGHVLLSQQRQEIEVSFQSRESGRSHACRIGSDTFEEILAQFWNRPPSR